MQIASRWHVPENEGTQKSRVRNMAMSGNDEVCIGGFEGEGGVYSHSASTGPSQGGLNRRQPRCLLPRREPKEDEGRSQEGSRRRLSLPDACGSAAPNAPATAGGEEVALKQRVTRFIYLFDLFCFSGC